MTKYQYPVRVEKRLRQLKIMVKVIRVIIGALGIILQEIGSLTGEGRSGAEIVLKNTSYNIGAVMRKR